MISKMVTTQEVQSHLSELLALVEILQTFKNNMVMR